MPSDKPTLAELHKRDRPFAASSRAALDRAALLAALEAVLALHHRRTKDLGDDGQYAICAECHEDWPCPTIRAISAHIDLGGDRG